MSNTLARLPLSVRTMVAALLALAAVSCASNSQESGFNAFLQTIAAECKPLIIGSDNIGQAIMFNGLARNRRTTTTSSARPRRSTTEASRPRSIEIR